MKYCSACKTSYPTDFQVCPKDGAVLSQTTELLPGLIIREKYQILEKIGAGGMATVYRARHLDFNEIFAIKLINHQFVDDETFIKRLRAEAVIARKLRHPHAVRIEDLDRTEDGRLFIVMEHVDGQDLRRLIRTTGALPAARVLEIAGQVCSALSAAHALGIVHRDIKPDNIQLLASADGADFVKVLDFGIAKLRRAAGTSESLTGSGLLLGTPQYLSPEQALGKTGAHIDGRSDLYSLGIVVYEMLTGRVPFESDTPMGLLVHHLHTLPPPPEQVRPDLDIPHPVSELLMQALQKQPENRFQSAEEMLAAIKVAAAKVQPPPLARAQAGQTSTVKATAGAATSARSSFPAPSAVTPGGENPAAKTGGVPQTHHDLLMAAYEGERPLPWRIVAVLGGMLVVGIIAGAIYSHDWSGGKARALQPVAAAGETVTPSPTKPEAQKSSPPLSAGGHGADARPSSATRVPASMPPASPSSASAAPTSRVAANAPKLGEPAHRKGEGIASAGVATGMPESAAPPGLLSHRKAAEANATSEAQPASAASAGSRPADKRRHAAAKAEASPEVQALLDEAQSFLDNADYDTALQDYEQVLKLDPSNSAAAEGKKKAINAKAYEEGLNR